MLMKRQEVGSMKLLIGVQFLEASIAILRFEAYAYYQVTCSETVDRTLLDQWLRSARQYRIIVSSYHVLNSRSHKLTSTVGQPGR